jgi:pyruvate,water dikinase
MYFYNSILRKQLEKVGIDITRLEMDRSGEEFHRYDPNHHLMNLRVLFRQLNPELQDEVSTRSYQTVVEDLRLGEFRSAMLRFMGDFGHLCDNGNDFSTVPWRENADTILKLVTDFQDPVDSAKVKPADKIRFEEIRLPLFKRFILRGLYERARAFSLYREQISYIYTLGYGLFRVYFMALGRHLAQQGVLEAPDDVFYIEYPELRRLAAGDGNAAGVRGRVAAHKAEIERTRHLPLPAVIYGTQPPVVEAASARQLTGTPTSRGYCTAPVKVVTGIQDFPKVKTGDILIIPYSDVGWTPLFARAAGVIAESGGMLSHSSIVAREYGIPAIVSVLGATSLSDGTLVSMDAYKGVIYIQDPVEIGEETLANSECQ